jgi:queuosine precursor transporter
MPRARYLDALTTTFVVVLLVSNLVAQKIIDLGPIRTSGAIVLFPITYIFGDIFTEVYGYSASRRAIWLGFLGTALLYGVSSIVIALPTDPEWHNQQAFQTVFGFLPRILAASVTAYWAGEFANSYTMAKLKLLTQGRWLWTRTVGSTVVGQAVDTTLVILLTFVGTMSGGTLWRIIWQGYLLKVAYEVIATPVTYAIVGALKRAEGIDAFDTRTNFNPFHLAMERPDPTQSPNVSETTSNPASTL